MQANPTGVNPFNGLSDDSKGAAAFESLWQAGALDSQKPEEAAALKAGREQDAAQQVALRAEPEPKAIEQPELKQAESKQPEPKVEASEQTADEPEYANLEDYLQKAGLERDSF